MNEQARIITHYLETIVRKAKLSGFEEMRAEIEAAEEANAARIGRLEARVRTLEQQRPPLDLRGRP